MNATLVHVDVLLACCGRPVCLRVPMSGDCTAPCIDLDDVRAALRLHAKRCPDA